jgi:hypothetical protein
VDHDEFRDVFLAALRDSNLPVIGLWPARESLDLRTMDRTVTTYVEPVDREVGRPFHVSGEISWRWDSLHVARSATTEDDLLTELLGREEAEAIDTAPSYLRIDVELRAHAEEGTSLPLPAPASFARWYRETVVRLESVGPLVPRERTRAGRGGRLEILAWQADPAIRVVCDPAGALRLVGVSVAAFQLVRVPRRWDDPDRDPDEPPHAQLAAMLRRLKAALHAFGEALDHLAGPEAGAPRH